MFKICKKCGKVWNTRDEFLELENLRPLGFQAHFLDGNKSVLLFQHTEPACNTTLAVAVHQFSDLIPGYEEADIKMLTSGCRGLCLTDNRLQPCDHPNCRNAMVRQFVQDILQKKFVKE